MEQTRLAREQVDGLLEDRRVKTEEGDTIQQRDADRIHTLTQKYKDNIHTLTGATMGGRGYIPPLREGGIIGLSHPLGFGSYYE